MTDSESPKPEQLVIVRDALAELIRRPGPWPTNDPLLAEVIRLAARVVTRDRKQQRTDERRRDSDVRDSTAIRSGEPTEAPAPDR